MAEHDALDPEQNEKPKIKVTDRRKFDAEGNRRADADEDVAEEASSPAAEPERIGEASQEASEPEATTAPADTVAETPGTQPRPEPAEQASSPDASRQVAAGPTPVDVGGDADTAADIDPEAATDTAPGIGEAAGESPSPEDLPRDFSAFVEGQYFETLLYLGAMRHPQTGEVVEDLDMAKYKIDILSMLQDKTEGNLTAEESKLIEDVVYQLRMAFLQKKKVAKL